MGAMDTSYGYTRSNALDLILILLCERVPQIKCERISPVCPPFDRVKRSFEWVIAAMDASMTTAYRYVKRYFASGLNLYGYAGYLSHLLGYFLIPRQFGTV